MTKARLERIVRGWQQKLGLERWEIILNWWERADDGCFATVSPQETYEQATIRWATDWASWDVGLANRVVAHELVHLFLRDIDALVADAQSQLHPQAATQVEKRYYHEQETLVELLARRFVALGGCV